jgi:hypothetical protein
MRATCLSHLILLDLIRNDETSAFNLLKQVLEYK